MFDIYSIDHRDNVNIQFPEPQKSKLTVEGTKPVTFYFYQCLRASETFLISINSNGTPMWVRKYWHLLTYFLGFGSRDALPN